MKILVVSHRFPPSGSAGTETYAAALALALARRGHAVEVFTATKDIARPNFEIAVGEHAGLRVHAITNNLYHASFRETWDEPRVDAQFGALLDRLRPDLVHVQHLLYLSAGCVAAARARGIPVVFTLHDYWLQCPRFGQRVHADGAVCHTIDFERCGTCLAAFKYAQTPLERRVGGVIAGVQKGTGIDLGPLARGARGAAGALSRRAGAASKEPDPERARALGEAARARSCSLRHDLVPQVDLFLTPSRFLRERFLDEWTIAPERIEHLPFGVDLAAFGSRRRTRADHVRVAFLGSLIPVKGAHVLLDAWGRLEPGLRARASLSLNGPAHYDPPYHADLVRSAAALGLEIGPALARDAVAEKLASTDLLVVPSLWYENSPLVILEALAARTPLLVSDLGGMAELVVPEKGGWHFPMGDAGELARQLALAIGDPARLARIGREPLGLTSFEEHVDAVEARYARVRAQRTGGPAR